MDAGNPESSNERIWEYILSKWNMTVPEILISVIESGDVRSGYRDLFKEGLIRAATVTGTI